MKRFFSVLIILILLPAMALAQSATQDAKDALEQKIKERFPSDSFVSFVQEGVSAGEYAHEQLSGGLTKLMGGKKYEMSVQYYHFNKESPDLGKYKMALKGATPLDDGKTFQRLKGKTLASPVIPLDEKLRLIDFKMNKDGITLALQADQTRHLGSAVARTRKFAQWGVEYNFVFPEELVKVGDAAILEEINRVLVPATEAVAMRKQTPAVSTPAIVRQTQEISIQPGMDHAQIIAMLGQPKRAVKFGSKETLEFEAVVVVLENGKVVEVK